MALEQFIAESALDAVQQIRAKLGPDAVVVNVRQLPTRWFQKSRIEVLAHVPEPATEPATITSADQLTDVLPAPVLPAINPYERAQKEISHVTGKKTGGAAALLESLGLLPVYAEKVLERVTGSQPPWLADELKNLRAALVATWNTNADIAGGRLHVFVGAPGSGKSTALCKWLTLSVLLENRTARVWRLDGTTANTSEALSVHGDVLGVPVERSWTSESWSEELGFVDLPGVNWSDAEAVTKLARHVDELGAAHVHLVLNGAYESSVLLAQVRAFSVLPITDLIVTHLDEESRWGKLWNLMLGTNLPVRFLSTGQNIPGDFLAASVERVLEKIFPVKS